MSDHDIQLHIDGAWRDGASGRTMPVVDPSDGRTIGQVARAERTDLEQAAVAAQAGFEAWRRMTAIERARIMRKAALLLRERADAIASLMTREQGKPLAESRAETLAAAEIVDWFADEGQRIYGRLVPSRHNLAIRQMVLKDPVGTVAAFTPWNFPINQVVRKVAAGLAAGCSLLVKGPEETPASPAALIRAFADAGVPAGVLGLVYGDPAEISGFLIAHPLIRKITFTGSTTVGKHLAALAGQHMKRATMELGGHAPVIVCDDADLELAVRISVASKFRNAGQVCISPTRFLVQRRVCDAFAGEFAHQTEALRVGNGLADGTQMGPLANARRLTAMEDLTRDAVARGARLLAGGERMGRGGNFWRPTVLADVTLDARAMNEEPFGPMALIRPYDTLEEAIGLANRLPYGLAAYAFTQSLRAADLLTRHVEAGMLWINMGAMASAEMPFGGVKDSGHGTEGGSEALEAYLNTRSVAVMNA